MEDFIAKLSGSSTLTTSEISARLLLAFILTAGIAWLYSRNYRGYGRPSQMALVLVLVALATCGIIMAIGDNLALSLGMVGALSIVRFRAAIKDNRDLAYLFWALTVGLVAGAGALHLALMLAAFIGAVVVVMERTDVFRTLTRKYIVILSSSDAGEVQSLLPPDAQLKSAVFHKESGVEESTFLVDFKDAAALATFKDKAKSHASLTGYQILGPEDTILG
jgi:hypothetical protein